MTLDFFILVTLDSWSNFKMNILIPHKWLMEQLDTKAKPKKIQEYVSLCGPSIERIYDHVGDKVYDIEITTNRPDSMSVRGIAREVAVILKQFDIAAKLKPNKFSLAKLKPQTKELLPMPKIKNDPKLNGRVLAVILQDVKRVPTPKWMADRLKQIEINVHDAAIDITNYITHEQGHPVHAFDYDKLMAFGEIIITTARKGEKFTIISGEEYKAVGGEVVFKSPTGEIIDLPGVKGTANSSIDDNTKNILLWVESVEPKKIRHASMSHAIRTVAAQINEKGIDPHLAEPTLVRGVKLYQELCEAKIASEIYDEFPGKKTPKVVVIDLEKINSYLGLEMPLRKVVKILKELECQVETIKNTLHITPPTFRGDLKIPVDIIEEIARIHGYHNLPSVLMPTRIPLSKPDDVDFKMEDKIKHYLSDVGLQEVYTYSMVSEEKALESGDKLKSHYKLLNSLTEDKIYMRRSLIPSLKEVIDQNSQLPTMSVFELANVYWATGGETKLPDEHLHLSIVSTESYRKIKGVLENLMRQFHLNNIQVEQSETSCNCGKLMVGVGDGDGKKVEIGSVQVLGNKYTAIDIEIRKLLPLVKDHPSYQSLPKTGNIIEQMTFTLPMETPIGPVIETIKTQSKLISKVLLTDIYQQNHTLEIHYWNPKKNLSRESIAGLRKKIVEQVKKKHAAELVGKIL